MRLPAIRLAYPKGKPWGISVDNINRAIRTPSIKYDQLQIGIPLKQDRSQCFLNKCPRIETWHDDADTGEEM
jgi:hypothetical protein